MDARERVVVPALAFVAAFAAVGAWRVGFFESDAEADAGPGAIEIDEEADLADPGDPADLADPSDPDAAQELEAASYASGDCVTWDRTGGRQADTDVVPCAEQHRIQITEEIPVEDDGGFPTVDQWGLLIKARCGPAAERFLGAPLDPYGRLYPDAIHPLEDGWAQGDQTMWCGIGGVGSLDRGADARLFTGDARGADQDYRFPVGSCVALSSDVPPAIVACTEGHQMEIVGEVDLSDRPELPTGAQDRALFDDCAALANSYLGTEPVAPWQVGKETMTPESWAAGSRVVHCFLGQWDAADRQVEVTGSAKG